MNDLLHILVVDEHPVVLEQMVGMLAKEDDLVVSSVAGGAQCLQALDGIEADVLLIDPLFRQELNLQLLRAVRENYPELRIVVLTAIADTHTRGLLERVGVDCVLEKGIASQELLARLRGK